MKGWETKMEGYNWGIKSAVSDWFGKIMRAVIFER